MFDMNWIIENASQFDKGQLDRGAEACAGKLIELDQRRREAIVELQQQQEKRNAFSKEIGQAKANKDEERAAQLMADVVSLRDSIQSATESLKAIETSLEKALSEIANAPHQDVPVGQSDQDNLEVLRWGNPPTFEFKPKQHFEIGELLGMMDFETAAKMSGARFVILKKDLARLERALAQFMLDQHTFHHGLTEVSPPLLLRSEAMYGTSQLPKFADDQFQTVNGMWLLPTSEVPLTNIARERIIDEATLPWRFTAYTPCFRLEAGAAGKDTRGMIRQHQFSKVEMVSITAPETSLEELERMTGCAEAILQKLDLAYRKVLLCTGDMGFASRKTYDLEVWLPGQNLYREISSCSVCGDFQARRMQARFRRKDQKGTEYVHTLNGSGLAVGRCLVAVMENGQLEDGSVSIPSVLQPYMGGQHVIRAQ